MSPNLLVVPARIVARRALGETIVLTVDATASRQQLDAISADANRNVRAHLPNVDEFLVSTHSHRIGTNPPDQSR